LKLSLRNLTLASIFTALMIVGAFVRIPFPFLPVTLQAFICAVAGLFLGPRTGAISMAVYALLGLSGLPVFAQGGGISYIFNGSFGFIAGFIAGTYVIGVISRHNKNHGAASLIKAVLAGLAVIYILGMAYMFIILRYYTGNTQAGILYIISMNLPYLAKDAILFIIAAFMYHYIYPHIKQYIS